MAAHRYWRLRPVESTGLNYVYIAEIQFATSVGGANVATGGVVSASSEFSVTYAPSKAFDANTTTYWSPANGGFAAYNGTYYTTGEYIQYVFASAVDLVEMKITAMSSLYPLSLALFWSDDGVKWTFQKAFTGLTWSASETKTFDLTYVPVGTGRQTTFTRRIGSTLPQPPKPVGNLQRTNSWLRYMNWTRPMKTSWLTGKKRIAGSTTVLGSPKARTVHLLDQRTQQILDTRHTDAGGTFEFALIADMAYTLVGEDRTKEQNSVIAANVTPVD